MPPPSTLAKTIASIPQTSQHQWTAMLLLTIVPHNRFIATLVTYSTSLEI